MEKFQNVYNKKWGYSTYFLYFVFRQKITEFHSWYASSANFNDVSMMILWLSKCWWRLTIKNFALFFLLWDFLPHFVVHFDVELYCICGYKITNYHCFIAYFSLLYFFFELLNLFFFSSISLHPLVVNARYDEHRNYFFIFRRVFRYHLLKFPAWSEVCLSDSTHWRF